jgi:hypothetical protein
MPVSASSNNDKNDLSEQALILNIKFSSFPDGNENEKRIILSLEKKLEDVIQQKSLGEFDGDEFGDGYCTIYMYGESVDAIFEGIFPIIKEIISVFSLEIIKRYGEPGALEKVIKF